MKFVVFLGKVKHQILYAIDIFVALSQPDSFLRTKFSTKKQTAMTPRGSADGTERGSTEGEENGRKGQRGAHNMTGSVSRSPVLHTPQRMRAEMGKKEKYGLGAMEGQNNMKKKREDKI